MVIQVDPRNIAASGAQKSVSQAAARTGMDADQINRNNGMTKNSGIENIAQAEFGNQKPTATTGTYAEEMARQMGVKEIHSDLDVMDPANFISQCMTGEDAHDLSEETTPLDEYTSEQLERALARVSRQRQAKIEMAEAEADRLRQTEESIRQKAEEIAEDTRFASEVSRVMAQSDLPAHEDNLRALMVSYDKAGEVKLYNQEALAYLITNESKVTPGSIHDSLYGSGTVMLGKCDPKEAVKAGKSSESIDLIVREPLAAPDEERADGFDDVRPQIESRLREDGREPDEEKMQTARWLYQNDLPVTDENLKNIETVRALQEMDDTTLLQRLVSEMEDGVLAENADLSHMSRQEVQKLVERLVGTGDEELKREYPTEAGLASARRRLEEIRLTMTVASAREMTKLGVSIDITNLESMVSHLRTFEQEARGALLSETSLTFTELNRDRLADTVGAADQILGSPVELLSQTFTSRQTITMEELASQGKTLASQYQEGSTSRPVQADIFKSLENTYEAVGTQVRADLGDSIKKAFGNMKSMLAELGLPDTAANERAVRILGYNNMAIDIDNIIEMKIYDNQVNNLMKAMKPQVVQQMIAEGINPLECSLSQLEREVNRIHEEVQAEDIAFSAFLWKLDKKGDITPEERESMIGIYRLLDKIEKSDGAVIGQLVNEGRELSLKNMLEAVRTRKTGHVEASIDDEKEYAAGVRREGKTIDEQIEAAFVRSEVPLMKAILSPKAMKEFTGDLMEQSIEELDELCREAGESDEDMAPYYEGMAEEVRNTLEEADPMAGTFLREIALPESIKNIIAASDFIRNRNKLTEELWSQEEGEQIVEAFDEPEELDGVYAEIEKTHLETLEERRESDDISFDGIKEIARMAGHVSFMRALRRYRMYEVPVMTGQGVVDCKVTIRNGDSSEKGTVEIGVDSEEWGKLQATFKLSGGRVNGFVTAERTQSIDVFGKMLTELEKDLEESGFTMDGNSLLQGNRNSLQVGSSDEEPSNRDLYRIAKCFLRSISR